MLRAARHLVSAANRDREVEEAIAEFAQITSLLPISGLKRWERAFQYEIWQQWRFVYRLFPYEIWRKLRSKRRLLPWLDCCDDDGYQRERALRASSEGAPNGFLFALVLRRLNDWVPQVRAAARECIPKMADQTKPEHIVEALWAIFQHLPTWGRLHSEDIDVLINLLTVDGVPQQFASKLIRSTTGPAASILGQASRKPVLDNFLSTISREAVQPAVRARAYRSLLEARVVWSEGRKCVWTDKVWGRKRYEPVLGERQIFVERSLLETLKQAARDRSPIVRRVAGDALIANLDSVGADARAIAKALSEDSSPSVAERGNFALKQLEP